MLTKIIIAIFGIVMFAAVIADLYFFHKRSKRPDFNAWGEV